MAKTKDGILFDRETGEIMEKQIREPTIKKHIQETTSYGRKRIRTRTYNNDPSLTVQDQAADTDINTLMRKIPYSALPEHQGIFQDLTEISDLHGAYEAIQLAETAMMALPAELRAKFDNDPKKIRRVYARRKKYRRIKKTWTSI